MRITSPLRFIMSTSIIMSLIVTLVVFQCGGDGSPGQLHPEQSHSKVGHVESSAQVQL